MGKRIVNQVKPGSHRDQPIGMSSFAMEIEPINQRNHIAAPTEQTVFPTPFRDWKA